MFWTKKDSQQTSIKEYWQATDAVSRPMAIALTLLIMFICLAVIFSLFMGGRWLYNSINSKKNQPVSVTETANNDGITDVGSPASSTSKKASGNANVSPSPTKKPVSTPKPSPTVSNTSGTNLPDSGPSELPNTGPSPE